LFGKGKRKTIVDKRLWLDDFVKCYPARMTRYAVIDFETTGLSPLQGDRALEIAAVIVENGEVRESWQSLMNPGIPVPTFITQLTGITRRWCVMRRRRNR
jgi:DNA polymerase III epsilon subunit-like protein